MDKLSEALLKWVAVAERWLPLVLVVWARKLRDDREALKIEIAIAKAELEASEKEDDIEDNYIHLDSITELNAHIEKLRGSDGPQ